MVLDQLLRPFAYLTIKHPAKKVVDRKVPFILTAIAMIVLVASRGQVNVWGDAGLVALIQSLVQGLPGFYIAALAAVATFGRQTSLDALIPEPTPTIDTWYGSSKVEIGLTRRRFLCLMFAHLTALSLALSILTAFGRSVAGVVRSSIGPAFADGLFYLTSAVYLFFVFQMLVVTLWGLSYLSDKMHQPDAVSLASHREPEE